MLFLVSCQTLPVKEHSYVMTPSDISLCEKSESMLMTRKAGLFFVGDIYLGGRTVPFENTIGRSYFYGGLQSYFNENDLVIANLESPLTKATKPFMEKKFILKADPKNAKALKTSGISMVSLANNHMMDYGEEGLFDTVVNLSNAGIVYSGAGENLKMARVPAIKDVNGINVAMISYSKTFPLEFYAKHARAGTAPGYPKYIETDILSAKKKNDIVVAVFHWGGERLFYPRHYQKELARLAIDSGADIVIGHHPHVMQGVERYKDGVIFYSLGNYVFGSLSKNVEGMAVEINVSKFKGKSTLDKIKVVPINVNNFEIEYNPVPLGGMDAVGAVNSLNERSLELGADMVLNPDFSADLLD